MPKEKQEVIDANDMLEVFGARVHNLKNIDVSIPRNKLVVITGISGSGKSSLAFDTIYAEGQRRYMESFGTYARQFIGDMERPDVDKITGLSPVISIEQKTTNKNPRSTVGTVTEIYDFMRLLFARASEAYSERGEKMISYTEEQILEFVEKNYDGEKIILLAPLVRSRKGHYRELFEQVRKQGYLKIRIDGKIEDIREKMQLDRYTIHDIELVVDRIALDDLSKERLKKSVQLALKLGKGALMIQLADSDEVKTFSKNLIDPLSGISFDEPSPNSFSFNSPYGACPDCRGLGFIFQINKKSIIPDETKSINEGGITPLGQFRDNYFFTQIRNLAAKYKFTLSTAINKIPKEALNIILYGSKEEKGDIQINFDEEKKQPNYSSQFEGVMNMVERWYKETASDGIRNWAENFMEKTTCPTCNGTRLKKESLSFKIGEKNIAELSDMDIRALHVWFSSVEEKLNAKQKQIAKEVVKEIVTRLGFLLDVGLEYLSLSRPSRSLSGGESQRIRLATQIGSQLEGITYILDEPSIGLHQRDNQRLITALKNLRDAGNTVIVVEHDKDIMLAADFIIDIGPGAGIHGGEIVSQGSPEKFLKIKSQTTDYLSGRKKIKIPETRRAGNGNFLSLKGARGNNLKNVNVDFPLGMMICVTGVSGSGKSSLINETLYPVLNEYFFNAKKKPLTHTSLEGIKQIDKVIEIDQSPIGRTPRSNPATYIGTFGEIRDLFASLNESKIRGYKTGRFSFNVKGGRCEVCEGAGMKLIEMNFLPDVYVPCERCMGKRYNRETLEVRYRGKSIADVLEMTVEEAVHFFEPIANIHRKIKTMLDVGLGYVHLGQQATTLSGGEAQRVKLSTELGKKDTGKTFYILDEPTTGLHFEDIRVLMDVLNQLVEKGNTVLIIEHNMDVIKLADYIIDLGPEGGNAGGKIIAQGTPEEVAKSKESFTAEFLQMELK